MSIFNAEAVAILEAIKATRRWGIAKKIILSDPDPLSNLIAQQKIYTRGNSKIAKLKDLLAEESESKSNVDVCPRWHRR
jgi:hypothetical protein